MGVGQPIARAINGYHTDPQLLVEFVIHKPLETRARTPVEVEHRTAFRVPSLQVSQGAAIRKLYRLPCRTEGKALRWRRFVDVQTDDCNQNDGEYREDDYRKNAEQSSYEHVSSFIFFWFTLANTVFHFNFSCIVGKANNLESAQPSCLGHVHAYQITSKRRTTSTTVAKI